MSGQIKVLAWAGVAAFTLAVGAAAIEQAALVAPGPNKVTFPADWAKGTLYATVDRPDTKQYREFYASPEVVAVARAGKPIPDDYLTNMAKLQGKFPSQAVAMAKSGPADVAVAGFAFGPAAIKVSAGQAVTWTNLDDTPHQITVAGGSQRSEVMLKGQSATLQFDAAGNIAYICGLHPSMKGTIEVVARP